MSRIKHRRPSPAILVAVIALVAALGGSAVAEVATTSKLDKKEKKQTKKIAKKQANKVVDGVLPIGASELGTIVERTAQVNVPANDRAGTKADCLDGETVIGGGGQLDGPNSAIYTSQREGNGWQGNAWNNNSGGARLFTVKVYCLK